MTADELIELARLCETSSAGGDAFIEQLALASPARTLRADGKAHLLVERRGSDPGFGPDPMVGVANLLAASCMGREVRKLRKSQEAGVLPADPSHRVPQEVWVVACETYTEDSEPNIDMQALACLRLLQPTLALKKHGWLVQMAREKLSRLMVTYPALMHPRLLWSAERLDQNKAPEPLPLAHAIARTTAASLPAPSESISQATFRAFARHPVVASGLTCRSPVTSKLAPRYRPLQGVRLGQVLGAHARGRVRFIDSLLRVQRVRREQGASDNVLSGPTAHRQGLLSSIGQAFAVTWTTAPANAKRLHGSVLSELKASQLAADKATLPHLLAGAVAFVSDPSGATQLKNGVSLVVTDQRERYARLTSNLVAIGACKDDAEAGLAVMRRLFPLDEKPSPATLLPDSATLDTAQHCVAHWLASGAEPSEIEARVGTSRDGSSPWVRAAAAAAIRVAMADVIERNAAPTQGRAGEEGGRRPRRAMGV